MGMCSYTAAMNPAAPFIQSLSIAERIQLAEDLWDSIATASPESVALTTAQLQAVQQRLDAHAQDPSSALPWDQVRAELFPHRH